MVQNNIDTFINKLLSERGYEEAPHEIKEQLHKDLKARLDKFVMTRTVASLSEEELEAFERLLDENKSPDELTHFAKEHIPDYTTFMTSTLLLFQDAYLA